MAPDAAVAVFQQLFCGKPVVELHAFLAATVHPKLEREALDIGFGRLMRGDGIRWQQIHGGRSFRNEAAI
jgi:hypothetical protein